jgi:hypothetical protein
MTAAPSGIAGLPNVPACFGWLSLDRRGGWRLQGEPLRHRGLIGFINRQYAGDESGRWFVQNGPQRVFVTLAYTPWVFRRDGNGFVSHTGEAAGDITAIYLDEEGNILLATAGAIALLDDRDLSAFLDECREKSRQNGQLAVKEENWLTMMAGESPAAITWRDLPIHSIRRDDVAHRFSFQPHPQP